MKRIQLSALILFALWLPWPLQASTLDDVRQRDKLLCGVNEGLPGFADRDEGGRWAGIDVDICRGVAAAIFGDDRKVEYVPLSAADRFPALIAGDIDLLSRNSTWTLSHDTLEGIDFAGVNFYDGQGFMISKATNVQRATDLAGATICVIKETTAAQNLRDYFKAQGMRYKPEFVANNEEALQAYQSGRCAVYTSDRSGLAALRSKLAKPEDHIILADTISKEPLGPAVSHGDNQWADIVRWTLYAMIAAEELGVSSANVDDMRTNSDNAEINRLLGNQGNLGEMLGLTPEWAYNIILLVGNYDEIYDNNVGPNTAVGLERGLNELWTQGGLLYAPPVR